MVVLVGWCFVVCCLFGFVAGFVCVLFCFVSGENWGKRPKFL